MGLLFADTPSHPGSRAAAAGLRAARLPHRLPHAGPARGRQRGSGRAGQAGRRPASLGDALLREYRWAAGSFCFGPATTVLGNRRTELRGRRGPASLARPRRRGSSESGGGGPSSLSRLRSGRQTGIFLRPCSCATDTGAGERGA